MDPDGVQVGTDRGRHRVDEIRIEGRGPRRRRGIHRGAEGGEPGQAFFVHQGGNTEPAGPDDLGLAFAHPVHSRGGGHRLGAEDPGEMSQAR